MNRRAGRTEDEVVSALHRAVMSFLGATIDLSDRDLEIDWAWREYDEGIRLAFFRTYEELRGLAVVVAGQRQTANPTTSAQRILAQVHRAQVDLDAVLIGVDDELGAREPAEGEWPIKTTLVHVIGTARQFYGRIHYAVERQRLGDDRPLEMPQAALEAFVGLELNREALDPLPFTAIKRSLTNLHDRIMTELVDLTDADLLAPSVWWEGHPYDVRFRMHRFDSHLRQHTVQIEKTLIALDQEATEARRLARLILGGLAEVEGSLLGAPGVASDLIDGLVDELSARTDSVTTALRGRQR